ncbi:MAG: TetR/AcrR family transcriptional regulator, partial [Mycobacterium sp.]
VFDLGVIAGRGRRAYDPDIALDQARDTFWRKGFAGTSLDDLAAGMGMNRPSIYAAFGDKRALYLRAVAEYSRASVAALGRRLDEPRSLRDGLRAVYQGACAFYQAGDQAPRGCFLIGTAVTEATRDPKVRAARDGQLTPLPRPRWPTSRPRR